jgi:hypothetical protein
MTEMLTLPYSTITVPAVRSHLRLIAGSDAVVVHSPHPLPGPFRRFMVRWLLGMEWVVSPSASTEVSDA